MPFLWPNCSGIQEQDWPPPLPLSKTQHQFQAGFRHNVRLAFHHITTNQRTSLQKDSSRLHTILVSAFRERERERGIGGKNMIIDTTYLQIVFPERERERGRGIGGKNMIIDTTYLQIVFPTKIIYIERLTHQARFLPNTLLDYPWSLRKKQNCMQCKMWKTWPYDSTVYTFANWVLTNLRNIWYEFKSWVPKGIISIDESM